MSGLVAEPLGSLADARPAWERVQASDPNPFATHAFASTWWRHLGAGRPLRLTALLDSSGDTRAILPLFVASDGARETLRLLGHVEADLLGPVCDPALRVDALAGLPAALGDGPVVLVADDVERGTAAALGADLRGTTASPVLDLEGRDWDAVLSGLTATHRTEIRRRERALTRMGRVELREADAASLERDFDTLVALHEARWADGSGVYRAARGDFHRAFAEVALGRGWLRLRVLEIDGVPVAVNHALRYGGSEWAWQTARDRAWDGAGVGSALQAICIRAAVEDGLATYRFLRGDEPYKYRWANRDEPVETVVLEQP